MTTDSSPKKRQRGATADYVETLINSSTLDQLRSTIARLSSGKPPTVTTRAEAETALFQTGRSVKDVTRALLTIEAQTPTRHCVLTAYSGEAKSVTAFRSGRYLEHTYGPTAFRAVHHLKLDDCFVTTFEHKVDVREWQVTDADTKKLVVQPLRHYVLLRLYPKTGIALFCFPGYTQGNAQREQSRLAYDTLIDALMAGVTARCQVTFKAIPINDCLIALEDSSHKRVRIVRTDLEAADGKMILASQFDKKSVNELLADFLLPYLQSANRAQLLGAINEAVRDADTNAVVANWLHEKVVTRIRFWPIGTEFLFIWHGPAGSFAVVERIMTLLSSLAIELKSSARKDLWEALIGLPAGSVTTLAALVNKTHHAADVVKRAVLEATSLGLLSVVYRVRTSELLLEGPNDWTADLKALDRTFTVADGHSIDGSDPNSIEVAFKRMSRGAAP